MDDTPMPSAPDGHPLVPTGIDGLDEILDGGLAAEGFFLVEGAPGTGKTTLGLHFLREGARREETTLCVTFTETESELRRVAASHGWSLEGVEILDLTAPGEPPAPAEQPSVFHPAEIELGETVQAILAAVERTRPKRVVVDSLSELRLLTQAPLRYRRELLALKHFLAERRCTVLLLDPGEDGRPPVQQESMAHGVLRLEQFCPEYGGVRRRLWISKARGQEYVSGYHDFLIERGGFRVFPRMVAAAHPGDAPTGELPSGVPELDALLGGGVPWGSSVLVAGPAGSGKSTIPVRFALEGARRGEKSALFVFDETEAGLRRRTAGMGLDLDRHLEAGQIHLRQVDPAELSAGAFAHQVREVVQAGAKLVAIDTLNGYLHAMSDERNLGAQLHELLTYLAQQGAITFLLVAQQGVVGGGVEAPVDASYIADTILLLRYFEADGEVRKALSVVKKRGGAHETAIRQLKLTSGGLRIGEPLRGVQGILSGNPQSIAQPYAQPQGAK